MPPRDTRDGSEREMDRETDRSVDESGVSAFIKRKAFSEPAQGRRKRGRAETEMAGRRIVSLAAQTHEECIIMHKIHNICIKIKNSRLLCKTCYTDIKYPTAG